MIADVAVLALPVHSRKVTVQHPDEIPVEQVRVNPEQPRHNFDELEMAELTESVRLHGVLIPILVERSLDGGYVLHDGERRWRAAQACSLAMIPARILLPGADRTKLINAMVANLHSSSMTIVEEALAYRRLGEVYGYGTDRGSQEKIARLLGITPTKVYNAMSVLKLPKIIQEYFAARKLPNTPDVVRALLHIPGDEARLRLAASLAGLPHPPTIAACKAACTRLVNSLQDTKVSFKANESGVSDTGKSTPFEDDNSAPAVRFGGRRSRDEWPEWDAFYQLGKVPPWPMVNDAIMATCEACAMRPVASESTCRECPLVDCLRRMVKAVGQ
jgi:ParB/RepB/Spo0J family partition protein